MGTTINKQWSTINKGNLVDPSAHTRIISNSRGKSMSDVSGNESHLAANKLQSEHEPCSEQHGIRKRLEDSVYADVINSQCSEILEFYNEWLF